MLAIIKGLEGVKTGLKAAGKAFVRKGEAEEVDPRKGLEEATREV